ncbi:MAG: lactate utilization protein [Oscillospiraceae bacterium]|nr:lactate utilization protein [Oscillospiraceae bacterium]
MEKLLTLAEVLEKNGMTAYVAENKAEALETVKGILKEGATVACGGSVTLSECGIWDLLKSGSYVFLDRLEEGISAEESERRMREVFFADFYLASSNAVTLGGELYNVDGKGNRVSAMMFGPKKVILVIGKNKIVDNIDAAIERVKTIAAPKNCLRLGIDNYCAKKGHCVSLDEGSSSPFSGCNSPSRICCEHTIIGKQREKGRISVILVNEDLGY